MDVVAELMIMANSAVAHRIYDAFPGQAILRCHRPPETDQLAKLEEAAQVSWLVGWLVGWWFGVGWLVGWLVVWRGWVGESRIFLLGIPHSVIAGLVVRGGKDSRYA